MKDIVLNTKAMRSCLMFRVGADMTQTCGSIYYSGCIIAKLDAKQSLGNYYNIQVGDDSSLN